MKQQPSRSASVRASDAETKTDPYPDTLGAARRRQQRNGPLHLRFSYILLVIAGGSLGTLARYGVDLAMPSPGGWPLPTLTVNIVGAFTLGLLLEALVRRGSDTGRRRTLRLVAGTGFLGAFTTYSALTLEAVQLFLDGQTGVAGLYLAVSLAGGVLASWAGIWLGHAHHRKGTP